MNRLELQRALAHLSPGQIAARYTLRGVHRLTGLRLFQGFCLTQGRARALPAHPQAEYGFVAPERLRQEATLLGSGLQPEGVQRLLSAGEECFGAYVGGTLASHVWFSPCPAHLKDEVFVHFDPAFAYSRWAFTREEYRGLHLHGLCKLAALESYAARGRRGVLSVVDAWNYPSLNAAAQVGCVRAGWMMMSSGSVRTGSGCRRLGMWLERG